MKQLIVFIVGPTSSGKTSVAVELAERISGEIISCDSMQVYKEMDVITHAPGKDIIKRVPHHLLRIIPPEKEYSVAGFCADAGEAIKEIVSRKKVPIIAGGTGLYMKGLLDGIFDDPSKDEALRAELKKEAQEKGAEFLYEKLKKVDPLTASKLHPNDVKRVIRAIEVYTLTGKALEEKKKEANGIASVYNCKAFGMQLERESLYRRINLSVDEMVSSGLVECVKKLKEKKLSKTAAKAIGTLEISRYLDGEMSLDEAVEEMKKKTRQYAKRQMTWFRGDKRVEWIDASGDAASVAETILKKIR